MVKEQAKCIKYGQQEKSNNTDGSYEKFPETKEFIGSNMVEICQRENVEVDLV